VHGNTGDVDCVEVFLGIRSMIVAPTFVKGSIDSGIGSGIPCQSLNTCIVVIIDIHV
jgi:hypothetical protein